MDSIQTVSAKPHDPPQYRPPEPPKIIRPTNQRHVGGLPTIIPRGEPILDSNGQPIQIQHGTILQPRARNYNNPTIIPVIVGYQMGPEPADTTCPLCQTKMVTRIKAKTNVKTHIIALLFGFLCLLPCVAIPYCTNTCRNTDHYCTQCNAYIGSYVR